VTTVSRRRTAAVLAIGLAVPTAVVAALLVAFGNTRHDVSPETSAAGLDVDRALAAIAVIVTIAHLAGALAVRLRQPRVVGQAGAGLLLGPSVLGYLAPGWERWLHSNGNDQAINLLAQLGVILFVFLVGRELASGSAAPRPTAALTLGASMTAIPLTAGVVLAATLFGAHRPVSVGAAPYDLFIGLLMAATAMPVLAHLLAERDLLTSPAGTLAVSAAAAGDAAIWCLLAVTFGLVRGASTALTVAHLAAAVGSLAALWWMARPALRRWLPTTGSGPLIPALLIGSLLCVAQLTDALGLHAIFGAFLFGLVMPADALPVRQVTTVTTGTCEWLLLPLFFAATGSRTRLNLADPVVLGTAAIVIVVAAISKIGSAAAAARMMRWSWRDSTAIGVMVNCRGMTELILLSVGRAAGIIDNLVFSVFVLMAVVTTASTGPLLSRLRLHRQPTDEPTQAGVRCAVTDR
jgi:Kef-type K+ transport system membrane component KefB